MGKKSRLKKERRARLARGETLPVRPPPKPVRKGVPLVATDVNFSELVHRSPLPVLVEFWAEWCGPCKMLSPVLTELAAQRAESLRIVKYDTEKTRRVSAELAVRSLPTLALFCEGELVDTRVGFTGADELTAWIDKQLASR